MSDNKRVLGFSGFSGSGKTTLIEKIVPIIKEKGFSVAVIKHDAHDFEIDKEGKDTWRFEKAGADHVYISSAVKSARMSNCSRTMEEMLEECEGTDIVFIEGYKYADIPRIGITCEGIGYELPGDTDVYRAIVTDRTDYFSEKVKVPVFDRDDADGLARWILGDDSIRDTGVVSGGSSDEQGEAVFGSEGLTHFDDEGNARMVTVADKSVTRRTATAGARVLVNPETFALIKTGSIKKGDVLTVAQVAGIMGAKRTPDLIPMCHPIIVDGVDVKLRLDEADHAIDIEAKITCTGRTGVEMEAITAVSIAAMTVYDMCKAVQRDIEITDIRLLSKSGGIHGDYRYRAIPK